MSENIPLKDLPYKNKGNLTVGSVRRHLVRLSIPMVWAMLAVMSVQLVDMYFISMLGTRELAGISFTFPITMLISHLVFGLNVAMSSVVSRLIGEEKWADAKRVTLHGLMLAFCVSAIVAFIAWLGLDPLFIHLGADAETLPVIHAYMPLWLLGSAVLAVPINGNSAIRAAGDTFLPAIIMLSIALINLVLAPVFIFGWLGFPALHVFGAALATFISYLCGFAFGLYVLVVVKDALPRDGLHLDKIGNSFKRLAIIAVPAGITNIITPAVNAFITSVLAWYGPEAVAAFGVVSRVEALSLLFVLALALGMAPVVGQNWGAGKYDRVHETISTAINANFLWSFFIAAVFGLFARNIGGAFSTEAAVIHDVTLYFWIVPITYGFGNLVFGWSSAFNAMGQPQYSFLMIFVKSIILTIPAVYLGSHFYGVSGIFFALAVVNMISGIAFHMASWRICLSREHKIEAMA